MIGDYLEDHGLRQGAASRFDRRTDGPNGTDYQTTDCGDRGDPIQQAIAAVEAVVVDLDTEVIASMLSERRPRKPALVC